MKLRPSKSLGSLLLFLLAAPLGAHDYWMEPADFRPEKDSLLKISLLVGDFGKGDELERKDERIVQFVAATPGGDEMILGRDGLAPAGFLRPKSEGIYVLGLQSNHASVVLEADKFMPYLDERGLDHIKRLRQERGESARSAREIYSRSPKAIVQVGAGEFTGWERSLGLTLELTPKKNPYELRRAALGGELESLPIQLTFQGRPLAGTLVAAMSLDAPPKDASDTAHVLRARTDAEGRVGFALPRAGRWMLAAVHMLALEGHAEADYESFWASLTFEVPEPTR